MQNKPLVSIFLPYYNDKLYIRDAIDAILKQTYKNWELFLFNHASTDGTNEIAHEYNDERIHHIDAESNLGAGSGYNVHITLPMMQGKYLKLLCADDMLKFDALENLVNAMENNPDKDIVFADMDYVDEKLNPLYTTWTKEVPNADLCGNENEVLLKFFKGYSNIAYPAAMIKIDAIKKIKLDFTMIMLFDVYLWVSLLIAGNKIMFLDKSAIDYRIHSNQLSSVNNLKVAFKQGHFELFQLLNLYYNIKNIEIIKYLCPCSYSSLLQKGDEEFIPFIVSYFFASISYRNDAKYFKDQVDIREMFGSTKLWELMRDESYRLKVQNKFNFGIKEFRDLYSYIPPEKNSIKEKIFRKNPKDLIFIEILYLILRKFINYFNPTYYVHKIKKNKNKNKYTV